VISDLFGRTPDLANEALLQANRWPAETHVIQVLHPREMEPDLQGEIRLVDVETKEVRRIWMTKREIARYKAAFQDFLEGIHHFCMSRRVDYFTWTTAEPFEDTMLTLLSRGNSLAASS